ncbi:hypothetical protein [Marivita sp. GX14005]|uniref:hypothetical protein n=1 Tax=Marivita sp. GX14005 TaxID=2942276 RepID=UPI002018450A|nr:hypothetical protein [Marivita sp. GX14005]MCL3881763.1 hypothetical protein [Marivita sp. GX14005]
MIRIKCWIERKLHRASHLNYAGAIFLALSVMLCPSGSFAAASEPSQSLLVNLNSISDWSTQHPFLNVIKSARPWIGHKNGQWGGMTFHELQAMGAIGDNGWPVFVPPGLRKVEALLFTDQPDTAGYLGGRYHLYYDGVGDIRITGLGDTVLAKEGFIAFDYHPGEGAVGIAISSTDRDDPVRNIQVVHEKHAELLANGSVFSPEWLRIIRDFGGFRVMDWMNTNDSTLATTDDLASPSDFSYSWRGVPIEVIVELANKTGADPWFTIPHKADDDVVREIATRVKDGLDPHLTVYVEYSNEMWNYIFEQAHWAKDRAEAFWGPVPDGWMEFYGLRAAQVMDIWGDVFSENPDRLRRVVAVHTAWPELEKATLYGPLAKRALGKAPALSFDAYAVSGYFGHELGDISVLRRILDESEHAAMQEGAKNGISDTALREFVGQRGFERASERAAEIVRQGSLSSLITKLWPYHAKAARDAGLDLVMYEGGSHAAARDRAVNENRLTEFLTRFNYSDDMGELYDHALSSWREVSDTPFNVFVDVAPPSKWGNWGALRHLEDDNPRWQALRRALGE